MKRLIPIFSLVLSSCSDISDTTADSNIKWGVLSGNRYTLINANTLLICGTTQELRGYANDAVWEWNNARGKFHNVSFATSCGNRNRYDASISVSTGSCPRLVVGQHTQSGNHHDITLCNGVSAQSKAQVMLHEVGHAYGLCDQYSPGNAAMIVFHPNCGTTRSQNPARSVMGGLYYGSPTQLTADDLAGITYLQKTWGR